MFQIQGLFAPRETVDEVIDYATRVGSANGDSVGTMTCTMMMYNTVGKLANARIAELEGRIAALEDRIITAAAYAANQRIEDTGAPLLDACRDELVSLGMLHDGTTLRDQDLITKVVARGDEIERDEWEGY